MSSNDGINDKMYFSFRGPFNYFERTAYHCLDCNDLPLIEVNDEKFEVNSICKNNHVHSNIPTNSFFPQLIKTSLSKTSEKISEIQCIKCNKKLSENLDTEISDEKYIEILSSFSFCKECQKYMCNECAKTHKGSEGNHHKITIDKLFNHCILHNEKYTSYCSKCKVNTCLRCEEHRRHPKVHLDDIIPFEEDIQTKKRILIDLKNYYETLKNNVIEILNNIRKSALEEIERKMNLCLLDELLLDSYESNRYNYQYIENVSNNLNDLKNQDLKNAKDFLYDYIKNYQITGETIDEKLNKQTMKELKEFNVTQTMRNTFKNSNEKQETIKFNSVKLEIPKNDEKTKCKNNNNNNNNNEEDLNFLINENTEVPKDTVKDIQKTAILPQSLKNSLLNAKKSNSNLDNSTAKNINNDKNEENINMNINNTNYNNNEIDEQKTTSKLKDNYEFDNTIDPQKASKNIEEKTETNYQNNIENNEKIECEFIGKISDNQEYPLNDLPTVITVQVEIKNTSSQTIFRDAYIVDEMNCGPLMPKETSLPEIEPLQSIIKYFEFEPYIYNSGEFHVKLAIKDKKGEVISKNKYDFCLNVK